MNDRATTNSTEPGYSFTEVAHHLQVEQTTLREWNRRFAQFLVADMTGDAPRYNVSDVAALVTVQKLLDQGFNDEQVIQFLTPKRIEVVKPEPAALALNAGETA